MSHSVTFDDGETLDLHTRDGAYRHVARFLRENGAPGGYFSSLEKLYRNPVNPETICPECGKGPLRLLYGERVAHGFKNSKVVCDFCKYEEKF